MIIYRHDMGTPQQAWAERGVAERKVLVNALEEGYVCELLPASYLITDHGKEQDFPALPVQEARAVLDRLIIDGLVGLYLLDDPAGELLGQAALARTADPATWTIPASGGLCLFLTPAGAQAVGIEQDNT